MGAPWLATIAAVIAVLIVSGAALSGVQPVPNFILCFGHKNLGPVIEHGNADAVVRNKDNALQSREEQRVMQDALDRCAGNANAALYGQWTECACPRKVCSGSISQSGFTCDFKGGNPCNIVDRGDGTETIACLAESTPLTTTCDCDPVTVAVDDAVVPGEP